MTLNQPCPICNRPGSAFSDPYATQAICVRCGTFTIDRKARYLINDLWQPAPEQRVCMSGWLREHHGAAIEGELGANVLMKVRKPTVHERAQRLLFAMVDRWKVVGETIELRLQQEDDNDHWIGITYSASASEVVYLLRQYLIEELKAVKSVRDSATLGVSSGYLTPHAHALVEQWRATSPDNAEGFCAMWYDKGVEPAWREAIQGAIAAAGYDPVRLDESQYTGKVDDEILAAIRRCKFVVADLTGERGGVYFEAGFALGLHKIVFWTVRESDLDKVHFDNRQYNFIVWKPDSLPEFKRKLHLRIEAVMGHGPHDTVPQ